MCNILFCFYSRPKSTISTLCPRSLVTLRTGKVERLKDKVAVFEDRCKKNQKKYEEEML